MHTMMTSFLRLCAVGILSLHTIHAVRIVSEERNNKPSKVVYPLDVEDPSMFENEEDFKTIQVKPNITSTQQQQRPPPQQPQQPPPQQEQRTLAIGDFDRFNELFKDATIELPDADVSQNNLDLRIRNLRCSNMYVGDIQSSWQVYNAITGGVSPGFAETLGFELDIDPLSMNCGADYSYTFGLFGLIRGSGRFDAVVKQSSAQLRVDLNSALGFQVEFPQNVDVETCNTNLNIEKIDFDGGLIGELLTLFQGIVANVIEGEAEARVCEELEIVGPGMFQNLLNRTKILVDGWMAPIPDDLANPLHIETNVFEKPSNLTLLNFMTDENDLIFSDNSQDEEADGNNNEKTSAVGNLIILGMKKANGFLGREVNDPNSPTGTGKDIQINKLLRDSGFLDENRVFTLNLSDAFFFDNDGVKEGMFDPVLFEGHDKLTKTKITLTAVRATGLDTMKSFSAMEPIGNYTLRNEFKWDSLALEMDLTVDIEPSTRPDTILVGASNVQIIENITASIDFRQLDLNASIFLAIDAEQLESVSIGSLLYRENLLPCLLGSIYDLQVTGLEASVEDMSPPKLSGFVSPGIDRLVSSVVDAALAAFEPTLLKALPNIFQGPVRNMLSKDAIESIFTETERFAECPMSEEIIEHNNVPEFIDFRDLLLKANESVSLGGSGSEAFGTMTSMIFELVQDQFLKIGSDGWPRLNEVILRPLTRRQSGIEGTFIVDREIFSFGSGSENENNIFNNRMLSGLNNLLSSTSFGENINLTVGNLRIANIDTVSGNPLRLLEPTNDPYTLENSLTIGDVSGGRPMNVTLRLMAGLFEYFNEIDMSMSIGSLGLDLDMFAMVQSDALMGFPLGDVLTIDCWLAAMKSVELDVNGKATDPSAQRGLALSKFAASMMSFGLEANCVACESPGAILIPELLQILQDTNATQTLGLRLPSFIDDIAMSKTFQTFLDRRVNDAGMFCPYHPSYSEVAVRPDYGSIDFPALSGESLDTLLFSGFVLGHAAFVVFAESQRLRSFEPSDPLSAQNSFQPPVGLRLIDWTNISGSTGFGSFVDDIFNQTRQALGGKGEEGGIGALFNISDILGDMMGEEGELDLELDLGIQQDDFAISVKSLKLRGLDNFDLFDLFEPIGPQTLSLSAQFDSLSLEILVVAESPSSSEMPQEIVVNFGVEQLNVNVALFAAFDLDKIGDLQLASLLNTSTILPCILSTAYRFEIPEMIVTVDSFTKPTFKGFSPETGTALSLSVNATFERYKDQITESIPNMFNGVLKESISALLGSFYNDSGCPGMAEYDDKMSFLDFRDLLLPDWESALLGGSGTSPYGDLLSSAYKILNDELLVTDPETGLAAINSQLISRFTESMSGSRGSLLFEGDLFNAGRRIRVGGLDANIQLRAYDAYLKNLDTLGAPLAILEPVNNEPHILNNTATMGIGRPVTAGVKFFVSLTDDETQIENNLDLSLGMDTFNMLLTALLKVSEKAFFGFPIKDIANLQCWLAMMPAPKLDKQGVRFPDSEPALRVADFKGSVQNVNLNISCIECSGSQIYEMTELLTSAQGSKTVTDLANGLFDSATSLIEGDFLNVAIDRALYDAPKQCPSNVDYDPNFSKAEYEPFHADTGESSVSFLVGIIIVTISIGAAVAVILLTTRVIVRRRHRNWVKDLSQEQVNTLLKQQNEEEERESELNASTTSMFRSKSVPNWLRLGMPVIILGNIGFFLSGHLNLGASVSIIISLAGQTFRSDNFFEFSMAKSTIEIWNAGGKELALIIFAASFAWPYTKQILTLGLWFVPPNAVSVSRRGSILLWLDALAKWSMIDIFVLVVTIVSMRISIKSPDVDFLPDDFYQVDMLVIPKWGLYANMTAQLISQISSHFIIHYHRRIVENASNRHLHGQSTALEVDESNGLENDNQVDFNGSRPARMSVLPEKLCDHAFRRPHRGENDKLVARPIVTPLLLFLAVALSVLVVVGCVLPTFSAEILGIIGIAVESGQFFTEAENKYSVFTAIKLMFDQAALTGSAKDYIGLGSLSILVILSVLIVPVVQSFTLLVQWFAPLTEKRRYRLSVFLEILQAWQYAEVYLLSVLVASWQLGPISEYMINPYCRALQDFFAELVYYGIIKAEDAQCLKADVRVEPYFYILFAAALVLALLNSFVMKAVTQYFHDIDASNFVSTHPQKLANLEDLNALENDDSHEDNVKSIHPVSVMYTDRYRWLLVREDGIPSASRPSDHQVSVVLTTGAYNMQSLAASPTSSDVAENQVQQHATVQESMSDSSESFEIGTSSRNSGTAPLTLVSEDEETKEEDIYTLGDSRA